MFQTISGFEAEANISSPSVMSHRSECKARIEKDQNEIGRAVPRTDLTTHTIHLNIPQTRLQREL